jgi:hypothetical protein
MKKRLSKESLLEKIRIDKSGCWIWQGALKHCARGTHRYGWVTVNGKPMAAHRAVWILYNGDLKDGEVVCHKCDVPQCCNPEHLFVGTQLDNIADMNSKGRHGKSGGAFNVKLTENHVRHIKTLLGKVTQKKIGEMYGVTQSAIARISTGKNWSWV